MNINDNPERLVKEEQKILDKLISDMDQVIDNLDDTMKKYSEEAKNADISLNPDLYLTHLLARKGMRDTKENRERILRSRDELYHTRLLLQYQYEDTIGFDEIKIGLHSCDYGAKTFVTSWKNKICRHYILDNASVDFECSVKDRYGDEYRTYYKLLIKNKIELRFTRVKKAINLFPVIFDEEILRTMKENKFFSDEYLDELINEFDPNAYNPDVAAQIIYDEFLQELLERRSGSEFRNIVFSIQKNQSKIIQAPYDKSMIVQGCAGSGKSMIMLHRLPMILFDKPGDFKRNSLYIITPSQMYIQMAENMRYQLEISDLNMGTIEQYYDYCIEKYAGHKSSEYGKINYSENISSENEKYIYSEECVNDIKDYFNQLTDFDADDLKKFAQIIEFDELTENRISLPSQIIDNRLLNIQKILNKNNLVLNGYFKNITEIVNLLKKFSVNLKNRKDNVIREITKKISAEKEIIRTIQKELDSLDEEKNITAINNRKERISHYNASIEKYNLILADINEDREYFETLLSIDKKINYVINPFEAIQNEFGQNQYSDIYSAIDNIGQLIGGWYALAWDLHKVEDKYTEYVVSIEKELAQIQQLVVCLQNSNERYLDFKVWNQIAEEEKRLADIKENAIRDAYLYAIEKAGIKINGKKSAYRFSPYLYLQTIYQYQGVPYSSAESLLSIDEAQGIAPEEIRLLKRVNKDNVIFNMYGDIYQHIEGTKGIDSWDEYKYIIEFEEYEMQENYRNASQITEYCNDEFKMSMNPINTPGNGVHVLYSESDFYSEMISQITDNKRVGLGAILVGDDLEAKYILDIFSEYEEKFHYITTEDVSIHHTRWNIININDAKGLEFSSVIVLSNRMSRNEKYIAYTRALDELFIYDKFIDVTSYQDKNTNEKAVEKNRIPVMKVKDSTHKVYKSHKEHVQSDVRNFFEAKGLEVIDKRNEGGRLWVIGDKEQIREIINEAIEKFKISGKYMSNKEIMNRSGWCTKTDK